LTGCEGWLVAETTPPPWDAPAGTSSDPNATATPITPTASPTVTLTPIASATPPVGPSSTFDAALLTSTAAGPGGALTEPVIEYFVAFPTEASPGDLILLFWKADNASTASIWRVKENGTPGKTWAVDTDGELSVQTTAAGRDEVYVLSVTNGIVTVEQEVTVTVKCGGNWFFEPAPEDGCPEADPQITTAVFQGFERGQIFWLQATNQIIVLFNDQRRPTWISTPNPWFDGAPDNDPSLQPPPGLFQPTREIGLVWRGTAGVRDRLGWALGDAQQFNSTYQRARYDGGDLGLYFSDTSNGVIEMLPDGAGWKVISFTH